MIHSTRPLLVALCLTLAAQTQAHTEAPVLRPQDNLDSLVPDLRERQQQLQQPRKQKKQQTSDSKPVTVTDEDMRNNPQLAEVVLSTALQHQDWKTLEHLLPIYRETPEHDPLLVHYIQGALYRNQAQHSLAIAEYRTMLEADSTLDNVRFDIAAMQFENKQYRDAKQTFTALQENSQTAPVFHDLAERYLAQIEEKSDMRRHVRLRFLHNDNINQTSNERTMVLGDWLFVKNKDALPKSSYGSNYSLFVDQEFNLGGNHNAAYSASFDGINYFDDPDYNEKALSLNLSYKYQDIDSWFSLGPLLDKRWLDGNSYGNHWGLSSEYGKWLNGRWQLSARANWLKKNYVERRLDAFNGDLYGLSLSLVHMLSPSLILFGGVSMQEEHLQRKEESSFRRSVNLGVLKQWNGLSLSVNGQYAHRRYADDNFFFEKVRRDNQLNMGISVSHKALVFYGIEPKLEYQYERIHSNIKALYSRESNQWMMTFEKRI